MNPLLLLTAQILWGPYLQDVQPDRATVQWSTRGPAATAITWQTANGPVTAPANATTLPGGVVLHKATLQNLTPGATYPYYIQLAGYPTVADPAQRLTTPASAPFRFLVIGDTGDQGPGEYRIAQSLEKEQASFLLHAGDIAYWEGTFAQYEAALFNIYRPILMRLPFYPTLGNHDATNGGAAYKALFSVPGLYYSFDWANVHFTVLDSNQLDDRASPMTAWLERDLSQTRQPFRIAVLHHPPFPTTDYKRDDPLCRQALLQLTPVFERQGVQIVIAGHEHIYQRTLPRRAGEWQRQGPGTIYVTTGGGGSQYYEPGKEDWIVASASGAHYLRVAVSETTLTVDAVNPEGDLLDRWQIGAGPVILPDGVRDAAAFSSSLAPGGLATIFGWNLSSASLQEWPILYNGRTQINAQVPYEAQRETTLTVTTPQGVATKSVSLLPFAPRLFTIVIDGHPIAAATHQDGRLVTAQLPASGGEWLSLYATGLGKVRGAIASGTAAPLAPLLETEVPFAVTISNRPAEVAVACLAPGFIGLYQINVRVPLGTLSGPQPIQLFAPGQSGNVAVVEIF